MHMTSMNIATAASVVAFAACGPQLTNPNLSESTASFLERASLTRGARLYDNWMKEKRVTMTEPNPGYAMTKGSSTNVAASWRCNECHGWDYRGVDGVYGAGAHFTGVEGVLHARDREPEELFKLIRDGVESEGMSAFSKQNFEKADLWDIVKFIREGTIDLSDRIDPQGKPVGADVAAGKVLYERGLPNTDPLQSCAGCHGLDGRRINFHTAPQTPEYLGTVAQNPWQFQHYVRFGYAGGLVMPAFNDRGWSFQNVLDVLSYAQTLPAQ
jgi:thiosulfate dehydrogenase